MHRAILCLLFVKIFHRLNGMQVAEQADEILRMERAQHAQLKFQGAEM